MTRYPSCSTEQHFDRPRDHVWDTIVHRVRSEFDGAVALSVEKPWRLCLDLAHLEPDLGFLEATFVLRDDRQGCHVAAGLVVEPEASAAGLAARDRTARRIGVLLLVAAGL